MAATATPPVNQQNAKPPKDDREPITRARKVSFKHKDELMDYVWRAGRTKGWQAKLIYAQLGDRPSPGDILIGQMESPKLAKMVVDDHNGWLTD